ncbi:MAG: hypothetical protein KY433_06150 [Actinobacteria bacterium]|nr:hypothetical protein [Actinomycetota bacterium]
MSEERMSEEHVSDEDVEGSLSEDEASPEVADELSDAKEAHRDQAGDPGATEGQGVETGVMGHAKPDTGGTDEAPQSEVPEGVDALTDEQIQAAQERGGGGGGDDDDGALDVSSIMQEGGAEGDAGDETGEDA